MMMEKYTLLKKTGACYMESSAPQAAMAAPLQQVLPHCTDINGAAACSLTNDIDTAFRARHAQHLSADPLFEDKPGRTVYTDQLV